MTELAYPFFYLGGMNAYECTAFRMLNYHDPLSIDEMSEPIPNWESIVHKNVRSKDGVDVGNVAEVDEQKFIVLQGVIKEHEYSFPHSVVDEFDGAEVRLNVTYKEVQEFLVK